GFGQWLQALAYALSQPREIAIIGDPDSANTRALLNVVRDGYRPFQVVALEEPRADTAVPLLSQRGLVDGQAAAYVCRSLTCQPPIVGPAALREQLAFRSP
ncbi:MAG: thioredoxin domain-containing protein, partial [Anaerolineae bacterium]